MSKIKRKINGDSWTIRVVDTRAMKKQRADGEHLAGLCVPAEKTIYIHEENLDYGIIKHELFHAYVSYLHLDDTEEVPLSDIEEIFAGMFTANAEKIIRQAKRITKDLKKELEGQE